MTALELAQKIEAIRAAAEPSLKEAEARQREAEIHLSQLRAVGLEVHLSDRNGTTVDFYADLRWQVRKEVDKLIGEFLSTWTPPESQTTIIISEPSKASEPEARLRPGYDVPRPQRAYGGAYE